VNRPHNWQFPARLLTYSAVEFDIHRPSTRAYVIHPQPAECRAQEARAPSGERARRRGRGSVSGICPPEGGEAHGAGGERRIAAGALFQDYLTTSLAQDEVITDVHLPALDGWGWGYEKCARRAEDWAMVGVCALISSADGSCEDVRIGLTNMGSTPLRGSAAEESLRGQPLTSSGSPPPPIRPPREPIRRATSTPPPTTSATWPGC
jgi:hypothetical protein